MSDPIGSLRIAPPDNEVLNSLVHSLFQFSVSEWSYRNLAHYRHCFALEYK